MDKLFQVVCTQQVPQLLMFEVVDSGFRNCFHVAVELKITTNDNIKDFNCVFWVEAPFFKTWGNCILCFLLFFLNDHLSFVFAELKKVLRHPTIYLLNT